jgi:hypothetical protein
MLRLALCLLMLSEIGFGQSQPPMEKVKKDVSSLQSAVNDVINVTIPGWGVLQGAKAAYLEGYGVVVNMEVAFDSPRSPFDGLRNPQEVRTTTSQRRKEVMDKLTTLLKQRVPALESIGPTESVAIILNLLNTNPADMPDMPSQIILSVKKQEAAAARINIREYK